MRSRAVILLLSLLLPLVVAACKKVDPAEQKKLLAAPEPKKREEAAAELKKIYAKDPKALGDVGAGEWEARLKDLPNASAEEQKQILANPVTPGSTSEYRLDDFYTVTITRNATLKIVSASPPKRSTAFVDVKPPGGFTGAWTTYYVTGTPRETDDYVGGVLKHTREMHDTGMTRREATMVEGKKPGSIVMTGLVVTRYPDGKPEIEETYDRGVLNGPRKQFYPSGKVRQEASYVNGELDGVLRNYREDGSPEWCIIYDKGREVDRVCPTTK